MKILNDSVLVLNKHLMAIQVTTVKDAITALVSGRVKVIDQQYFQYDLRYWVELSKNIDGTEEADKYCGKVHSPSITIYAPQVVVACEWDGHDPAIRTIKYSRRNVFQRDNFICQYCGKKVPQADCTIDHVIPRSSGGSNLWTNVVTSCIDCNTTKGNKTIEELGWKLLSKPATPRWRSHVGRPFSSEKKTYWETFLSE